MPLPITSATAAALALLLLVLAVQTVRHRFRLQVGFGDGGDQQLTSATRSHGNLAEHAPIVLIMMGLLEYGEANPTVLSWVAVAFVLGRVAHAVGLHGKPVPGKPPIARQVGVAVTWLVLLGLSGHILFKVFA